MASLSMDAPVVGTPLNQMGRATLTSQLRLSQLLSVDDQELAERVVDDMHAADATIEQSIASLDAELSAEPWWGEWKAAWSSYLGLRDGTALPLLEEGRTERFVKVYERELNPLLTTINEAMTAGDRAANGFFAAAADTAEQHAASSVRFQLLVFGIGLVLAVSLALVVAPAMKARINKIRAALAAMAQGDLTVGAGVAARDELGQLADAFNDARASFQAVIAQVVG